MDGFGIQITRADIDRWLLQAADYALPRVLQTVGQLILGVIVFLLTLAPAGAILYAMPGNLAGWAFVLAIVFAWACISAFVEPCVIAAMMQVYFKAIEGQVPDPEWDRRLSDASKQFRELKDKALEAVGGSRWAGAARQG